jgi:glycosyltransferase involved in cell wall biosynthesis
VYTFLEGNDRLSRILVLSRNRVGRQMSAPGIRALNVARTLVQEVPGAQVTLALPDRSDRPGEEPFAVEFYDAKSLPRLILNHDVIVAQYVRASALPFVLGKRLVLDFFANFVAEWLELWLERPDHPGRTASMDSNRRYLNLQLSQADLVLAANRRQRNLWLGALAAVGRVTPEVYDADPSLRSLIDVAPFGIRSEAAVQKEARIKGVYPGIEKDDFVLIWSGGILHWYDPTTLLQAMAIVSRARPDVKLFFLGTKYPTSDPIEGQTLTDMLELSAALGLTGRSVFFNEGWVDYEASGDYLIEADAGICTYFMNMETEFAWRVRLVDLIWAETPIICNRGDETAGLVEDRGLGLTIPQRDVNALADGIIKMRDDAAFRRQCAVNERSLKPELSWSRSLQPLTNFCREMPEPSPSRSAAHTAWLAGSYFLSRGELFFRDGSGGRTLRKATARLRPAQAPASS